MDRWWDAYNDNNNHVRRVNENTILSSCHFLFENAIREVIELGCIIMYVLVNKRRGWSCDFLALRKTNLFHREIFPDKQKKCNELQTWNFECMLLAVSGDEQERYRFETKACY